MMTIKELSEKTTAAKAVLPRLLDEQTRKEALTLIEKGLFQNESEILEANAVDLKNAQEQGLSAALCDRLLLTKERLSSIAQAVGKIKELPDPLQIEKSYTLENGLRIEKRRVPLGVIAMIYEARPNVTVDAAALSLKSGNAVVLKGGKEAFFTNRALVKTIREMLSPLGLSEAVYLVEDTDRAVVDLLLSMRGQIDLIIPRGGKGLIRHVVENSKVPVIETGAGNCHIYVHEKADFKKALAVLINAKTSRPSVCNAAETLICDEKVAADFLKMADEALSALGVELRADDVALPLMPHAIPASEEDFATEYNDYILAVKTVSGIEEAIAHIERYGTCHSEAILTEDEDAADYFMARVDAAAVYHNASTRFTDGGVFGMGAEIGISTQKLHARGPFALDALTTSKYRVYGNGQTR